MKINYIRRIPQITIMILFVLGNLKILEILTGDLSGSKVFKVIPLTDPFAFLQVVFAGFTVSTTAAIGALIIFCFYALIAPPRAFCSWICPVNIITDFAHFIRVKFKYSKEKRILNLPKNLRYYILVLSLPLSLFLSIPAFENISWIGFLQRGIIFTDSMVIGVIFCIFVFDAFIADRGVCSHICPTGAFYALIGKYSLLAIEHNADKCIKCMECKLVCPENQVLDIVGKQSGYIKNECISCGRCIDVCSRDAFEFSIRNLRRDKNEIYGV